MYDKCIIMLAKEIGFEEMKVYVIEWLTPMHMNVGLSVNEQSSFMQELVLIGMKIYI